MNGCINLVEVSAGNDIFMSLAFEVLMLVQKIFASLPYIMSSGHLTLTYSFIPQMH